MCLDECLGPLARELLAQNADYSVIWAEGRAAPIAHLRFKIGAKNGETGRPQDRAVGN